MIPTLVRLALLIALLLGWRAEADSYGEYRLKAAFLYRISQFVEWPEASFGSPQDSFAICVLGTDPFGESLKELAARKLGNRAISLQYPASIREARACQIVYVDQLPRRGVPEMASDLGELPVLLVSSTERFAELGGAIGFVVNDGKLRMEINVEVLRRANLKPSAKLLEVASKLVGSAPLRP